MGQVITTNEGIRADNDTHQLGTEHRQCLSFHTSQRHPFIWIFASFSEILSCTVVSVFDNLLKHIFINKVSKKINFILDGFCSTNWSSLVCLRLRARVLDDEGHVVNTHGHFFLQTSFWQ